MSTHGHYQAGYDAAIQNQIRDHYKSEEWLRGYDRAVRDTLKCRRPQTVVRHTFQRSQLAVWMRDHAVVEYHEEYTSVVYRG